MPENIAFVSLKLAQKDEVRGSVCVQRSLFGTMNAASQKGYLTFDGTSVLILGICVEDCRWS